MTTKLIKNSESNRQATSYFNIKEFEHLPDLDFPVACNDLCFSRNGNKLLSVGIYKPCVKYFDFKAMSHKFVRHLVCDPLRIVSLDDDADKFAILRNDKTIELHMKSGLYEAVKTPKQPTCFHYNRIQSELYIGGEFNEIHRLNLEQGKFMKNIPSKGTFISFSEVHGLLGAVSDSELGFFDSRSREFASSNKIEGISSFNFSENGLKYCIGTNKGECIEFDFRSTKPIRNLKFEDRINKISYVNKNIMVSSDMQIAVISEQDNCDFITPEFKINTFDVSNGLIFVGGENDKIKGYCSDKLGDFPNWFADLAPK